MNEDTRTKCEECGAYSGHGPLCSKKTLPEWIGTATFYYHAWLEKETQMRARESADVVKHERVKAQATFWQGKYSMVKHENNKLRAKLKFGQPATCEWQDIKQADKSTPWMLLRGRFNPDDTFIGVTIGRWHQSFSGDIDQGWWVAQNTLKFYPTHFCELPSDLK